MATKQALWVHGTSVQAEREGYHISRSRPGWGAEFMSQGDEWFHFAIPTPVIFGGYNSELEKCFVLFRTTLGAKISMVHLYDGATKLKEFNDLNLSGAYDTKITPANTFAVPRAHLLYGLGISVRVLFGSSTPQGVPMICFTSAGADFLIPN